jgi:alpha-tubulin suppressor-like RCC1 family protein
MSEGLGFENNVLYNKLKHYFKDNIKLSLKTEDKIIIVTKDDNFYKINIYEINSELFLESDYSVIEKMIVKEFCSRKIIDLTYGGLRFIAKSEDNKFFYCDYFNNYYLTNGKKLEKLESFNSDSNSIQNDSNIFSSYSSIISVKCGIGHSLALTQKGEVYAWGDNSYGQIGNGSNDKKQVSIKLDCFDEEIVTEISCGSTHSMALTNKGHVFSWGDNRNGQLGHWGNENSNKPKLIEMKNVLIKKISCGPYHSLLLSNDGIIYGFGNNERGQIGVETKKIRQNQQN